MNLGQMRRPWQADTGPNRYRRGLYTFFWRATPHPFLTTFDAPGGVQTCTRRFRSDTPLQALTLLNDPAFVEIARWARRPGSSRIGPTRRPTASGFGYAFLLCLGAHPTDRELETLETVLDRGARSPGAAGRGRRRASGMGDGRPGALEPR